MYRMFNRLPKGLEPMAEIFRKHVEEEGECAATATAIGGVHPRNNQVCGQVGSTGLLLRWPE